MTRYLKILRDMKLVFSKIIDGFVFYYHYTTIYDYMEKNIGEFRISVD